MKMDKRIKMLQRKLIKYINNNKQTVQYSFWGKRGLHPAWGICSKRGRKCRVLLVLSTDYSLL